MKRAVTVMFVIGLMCVSVPLVLAAPERGWGEKRQQESEFRCPMHPEMEASWTAECPRCGQKMMSRRARRRSMICPMHGEECDGMHRWMGGWGRPGRPGQGLELARRVENLEQKMAHLRNAIHGLKERKAAAAKPTGQKREGKMEGMEEKMKEMMARMPEPMRLRHKILMGAKLSPFDPASVLALKEKLDLTEEQYDRVKTILKTARAGVKGMLTEEQLDHLKQLAETPSSMKEMHERMMEKMKEKKEGATRESMMKKMKERRKKESDDTGRKHHMMEREGMEDGEN